MNRRVFLTSWLTRLPLNSQTTMVQDTDIVSQVKAVEAEVSLAVKSAEEARREAITGAEASAARTLAEAKARVQAERVTALERARNEVEEMLARSDVEAENQAKSLKQAAEARLQQAADLLVDAMFRQWQLTE